MRGPLRPLFQTLFQVACDLGALIGSAMRSRAQLAAENVFLRKQLALYLERQVKPRRADDATRITSSVCRRTRMLRRTRPTLTSVR
jgi:hypothetical protein